MNKPQGRTTRTRRRSRPRLAAAYCPAGRCSLSGACFSLLAFRCLLVPLVHAPPRLPVLPYLLTSHAPAMSPVRLLWSVLLIVVGMGLWGCVASGPIANERGAQVVGEASYYADKYAGRTTASGDVYDPNAMTAAHKSLPFGTRVRVTRLDTGASVTVRINDRGPFRDRKSVV